MKIIYNCYGGSHSSVTSAAIHLGLMQCDEIPCASQLWRLPYYDNQVKKDHGVLHFMGTDEFDNQIYVVGRRNMARPVKRLLTGLAKVYGIPAGDFRLVDPMPYVNLAMVFGGFTSRRLGLIPLGRPVVTWGTRLAFPQLVSLVQKVKRDLKPSEQTTFQPLPVRSLIYCDYTGTQQAAQAAALHLGKKPRSLPQVPAGTLLSWGNDAEGNRIFTLGVSYENELLPKIIREFAKLYGIPAGHLLVKDLTPMKKIGFGAGALLQYYAPLKALGRRLTESLLRQKIPEIARIVKQAKEELG